MKPTYEQQVLMYADAEITEEKEQIKVALNLAPIKVTCAVSGKEAGFIEQGFGEPRMEIIRSETIECVDLSAAALITKYINEKQKCLKEAKITVLKEFENKATWHMSRLLTNKKIRKEVYAMCEFFENRDEWGERNQRVAELEKEGKFNKNGATQWAEGIVNLGMLKDTLNLGNRDKLIGYIATKQALLNIFFQKIRVWWGDIK